MAANNGPLRITHNGETHTVKEWARITGVNANTILWRYRTGRRGGYLFEPVVPRKKRGPMCRATSMRECFECKFPECIRSKQSVLKGEREARKICGL